LKTRTILGRLFYLFQRRGKEKKKEGHGYRRVTVNDNRGGKQEESECGGYQPTSCTSREGGERGGKKKENYVREKEHHHQEQTKRRDQRHLQRSRLFIYHQNRGGEKKKNCRREYVSVWTGEGKKVTITGSIIFNQPLHRKREREGKKTTLATNKEGVCVGDLKLTLFPFSRGGREEKKKGDADRGT